MKTSTTSFSRWKTFWCCALILLFSPAGWGAIGALQMAPLPRELNWVFQIHRAFSWIGLLLGFSALISLPFVIINDVLVRTVPRFRHWSSFTGNWPRIVQLSFVFAALSFLFIRPLANLRYLGLPNIARNAQPLIIAIEKYRKQNKQYPDSLDELVPKYIAAIPYTGAVGFPAYEYWRVEPSKERRRYVGKETYVLHVDTPIGGINWDKFMYSPDKKYLYENYGREVEWFGSWAYHHE